MAERIYQHIERKKRVCSVFYSLAGWLCVFTIGYAAGGIITGYAHMMFLAVQIIVWALLLGLFAINSWHLANVKNLLKEERR
jgi:hypothetical protein